MSKVLLISQLPLPYSKIGSWTTLYKNYMESSGQQIDCIICKQPADVFSNVHYEYVIESKVGKLKQRVLKNPYLLYFEALNRYLKPGNTYVIQIVDNFGFIPVLQEFLENKGLRASCYIQFFYHGFAPFYGNFQSRPFYEAIDEMVLLTYDSYIAHKNYYTVLPCKFSVLHNGIDTSKFYKLSVEKKQQLKSVLGLANKTVFLWCSQDRPKKGLDFILGVWKSIYKQYNNVELWVVGASRTDELPGIVFKGRIPNVELPKYYQAADCYLFPTLCHEGFGLSLVEALHSGCYCIASALGGVPEVLDYGGYGKLIEHPHFENEWRDAIVEFMERPLSFKSVPQSLYSKEQWNSGMNSLIQNAKEFLKP